MVYILLENGFEQCEALAPVDILRRAAVDVALVGVSADLITSSLGVTVKADMLFRDICTDDMEMLIIPGGQPGVDNLWKNPSVRELVKNAYSKNIPIGAICAAPIILARLGILDGKDAVCYPSCKSELSAAHYMPDTATAKDGNIITARAAADAFEFSFLILRFLRGTEAEQKIREAICHV